MRKRLICALALAAASMGCAAQRASEQSASSSVGTSQIDHFQPPPSGSQRVGAPPPMVMPPMPITQALPIYPESALEAAVACEARILYHVDTSGKATLVRLEWKEPPPTDQLTIFEEAIRTAVSEWTFHPAFRIVPKTQDDGSIEPVQTPLPKASHAFIRFRVEDGQAIVE